MKYHIEPRFNTTTAKALKRQRELAEEILRLASNGDNQEAIIRNAVELSKIVASNWLDPEQILLEVSPDAIDVDPDDPDTWPAL